ncbi:hypothetical protein PFISCL1PPCAC_17262 [Pristionchus fissidentatus]|uniref:Protein arginine N-methyltransferase 6 n=1 Tax=Pristionchus fissidentatus TaxID=1538716 RepID=A0AAV5W6G6_9BILA|nr:hypothetical protein PFISCL1PPCAC_17262 [Pristionchus fissidentatus]
MRECYSKALTAWSEDDYKTAIREYLKNLIMADEKERMERYQEQFCSLLNDAARAGVVFSDKHGKLQNELFPRSPLVQWTLGTITMKSDPLESMTLFRRAYNMSTGLDKVMAYGSIMACRSSVVSTWHIKMVNDMIRNNAYNAALSKIVKRGSNVIDIGAGTGLLSMLATRYTDQPVVGLEGQSGMAKLAAHCVETNELEERVHIESCMSSQYLPPFPTDVVVSETMDAGGLGEKIIQIFHDAHLRYKGTRPITFCPQKLTFYIRVVQSDKFWRARCHHHNCRAFGCGDDCQYAQSGDVLISHHEMNSTTWPTYTTLDPDDYDDLVYLSDPINICSTPLHDENWLLHMKTVKKMIAEFHIPISTAGRADAAVMGWVATLTDEVKLDSVRKGGWEFAAYPFAARTEYVPGQTFFGQWVMSYDQGMIINQIQDPTVHPGRFDPVLGPYQEVVYNQREDGTVEMANNESLRRFLSPSRLSSWLQIGRSLDWFFPVTAEGTLHFNYLNRVKIMRFQECDLEFDTITSVRAYGCLFKADHIDNCARQRPSSHCGVNLANLKEFSLFEYREIRGAFRGDGRFTMLSEPVLLVDIDPRQEYEQIFEGCTSSTQVLASSEADGVLYWWVLNGEWSNREADLPLAAYLFGKREMVRAGQMMTLSVFLKDCELIISHGDSHLDTEVAAPPPAVAAVAPPLVVAPPLAAAAAGPLAAVYNTLMPTTTDGRLIL